MTAIIIVNYIKYKDSLACVESIINSKTTECYHIVVVDNASSNDSWQQLQLLKQYECVTLLLAPDNHGYCAGNNIGIKYAMESLKTDFIWILNPDTLVETDTLQQLHDFAITKTDLGILGCKLVYYPDTQYIQALGGGNFGIQSHGELRPGPHLYHLMPSNIELPEVVELDLVIGASMYMPVKIFETCGLMNERFHLYADENEFCLRTTKYGFHHYAISRAVVYHKEGWRESGQQLMGTYYNSRNTLYLIQELFPEHLKKNLFVAVCRIFTYLLRGKLAFARMQVKGIYDFLKKIDGRVELKIQEQKK